MDKDLIAIIGGGLLGTIGGYFVADRMGAPPIVGTVVGAAIGALGGFAVAEYVLEEPARNEVNPGQKNIYGGQSFAAGKSNGQFASPVFQTPAFPTTYVAE